MTVSILSVIYSGDCVDIVCDLHMILMTVDVVCDLPMTLVTVAIFSVIYI